MKLPRLLLLICMFCHIYANTVFCQETSKRVEEEITMPQPLAIGTRFYTKSTVKAGHQAYYTHMGFEGNYIKVKYELYYHYEELQETDIFTLPLNADRQSVLCTKPLSGETPATTVKLLITVVDDFGRIKVQKYK